MVGLFLKQIRRRVNRSMDFTTTYGRKGERSAASPKVLHDILHALFLIRKSTLFVLWFCAIDEVVSNIHVGFRITKLSLHLLNAQLRLL